MTKLTTSFLLGVLVMLSSMAEASYNFNQRMAVQGYLKSGSSGLTTGTYSMRFVLKNNNVAVWTKTYSSSVQVVDGLFTQILSGSDDSSIPLSSVLLDVPNNSAAIQVDVIVDTDNNGIGVGSDSSFTNLDITPSPMALLSHLATNLTQNGATAGQALMWNNSTLRWEPTTLSPSTLPANMVGATQLSSGSVTSAKIGTGAVSSSHLASGAVDLTSATVTGVLPLASGGTGVSTTPNNGQLLIGDGSGYVLGTLTAGSGISITNGAGSIQISTSGGGGSVSNVSGVSPLSVANGTSTPVVSLEAGSAEGQSLRWDNTGSSWVKTKLRYTDLVNSFAGNPWPASTCTSGQFVVWSSVSDSFTCSSLTGAQVTTALGYTPSTAALNDGQIFVGNASNVATAVTPSGDLSLSNAGVFTLANSGVGAGTYQSVTVDAKGRVTAGSNPTNLAGYGITDALQNAGGTPSLSTGADGSKPAAGTAGRVYIASDTKKIYRDTGATWEVIGTTAMADLSGTLPANQGGTGQTAYSTGDLLYASSGSALSKLSVGADGQVLTLSGGVPAWQTGPSLTGNNTYTGTNQFNGGVGAGTAVSGGTNLTDLKVCSAGLSSFNMTSTGVAITRTMSCTGVTTAMAVSCSPTGIASVSNNPVWSSFVSANDTITIRAQSTSGTSGTEIAATTWKCLVFQ